MRLPSAFAVLLLFTVSTANAQDCYVYAGDTTCNARYTPPTGPSVGCFTCFPQDETGTCGPDYSEWQNSTSNIATWNKVTSGGYVLFFEGPHACTIHYECDPNCEETGPGEFECVGDIADFEMDAIGVFSEDYPCS